MKVLLAYSNKHSMNFNIKNNTTQLDCEKNLYLNVIGELDITISKAIMQLTTVNIIER